MDHDARFRALQLPLPPAPKPVAVYVPSLTVGNLLFLSGHGPLKQDQTLILGKVGVDLSLDEGHQAARQTGLAILATLYKDLGSLNRIKRLVKVLGLVNCPSDFKDQPKVINGFSELMVEVFGESCGKAARSAVGAGSLPGNMAVEIEAIFELAG